MKPRKIVGDLEATKSAKKKAEEHEIVIKIIDLTFNIH